MPIVNVSCRYLMCRCCRSMVRFKWPPKKALGVPAKILAVGKFLDDSKNHTSHLRLLIARFIYL
jgi:hypothetical protein